jgi:hypothetical protein
MSAAELELRISQLVARARLLERLLHDDGPWYAVIHGCRRHLISLTRQVLADDGRIMLSGYLREPCRSAASADIFCREDLVTSRDIPLSPAPFRMTLMVGVEDTEIAA